MWPAVVVVGMLKIRKVSANSFAVVSMASPRGSALDAAKLYRRGLVHRVWITPWIDEPADRKVDALGLRVPRHHEVARSILVKAGVPASAIRMLDRPVNGLEGEMAVVGRALRELGVGVTRDDERIDALAAIVLVGVLPAPIHHLAPVPAVVLVRELDVHPSSPS